MFLFLCYAKIQKEYSFQILPTGIQFAGLPDTKTKEDLIKNNL